MAARSRHSPLASPNLRTAGLGKDRERSVSRPSGPAPSPLPAPGQETSTPLLGMRRVEGDIAPRGTQRRLTGLVRFPPSAPALTAQLVSDSARELLGHLTPGSGCKERKRRADGRVKFRFMRTMAINPGFGKGLPAWGSSQRAGAGGMRGPGSPARPDLRLADLLPREAHTSALCTCLPGANRFGQTPLPALLQRGIPRYRSCPFPRRLSIQTKNFLFSIYFSFSQSHSIPLQGPDSKMVAVPRAHGIRCRGDGSQTSLKRACDSLGVIPRDKGPWGFGLLGHRGPTPRAGEVSQVSCCRWETFVFPSPANPGPPAKLACCRPRLPYLCRGSRDPRSHLQTRRTKSRSLELPSARETGASRLRVRTVRELPGARPCARAPACVCECGGRRAPRGDPRSRAAESGCHTGTGNVRVCACVRVCVGIRV